MPGADKSAQEAEAIEKRLAALEEAVEALRTDKIESATPDGHEGTRRAGKGWVTDLKPDEEGWVEGNKPPEKSVAQSGETKPWDQVPGPPEAAPESIPETQGHQARQARCREKASSRQKAHEPAGHV